MMRLSIVLAVVAALTASVSVSAETECAEYCLVTADCCPNYDCIETVSPLDVSMSSFHPGFNPLTYRHGRVHMSGCVTKALELVLSYSELYLWFRFGAVWLIARHVSSSLLSTCFRTNFTAARLGATKTKYFLSRCKLAE
ncbi:hypothetical protein EDB19DRAFT_1731219 [Suillus lakei]|nr:hypothetical protein EDB19DRAFT_1731219 [Suillus lakei]